VTFVCLQRPEQAFNSGPLGCVLTFKVLDDENSTDGVEDQYKLEEVEVKEVEYTKKGEDMGLVDFKRQWESLGEGSEIIKKYNLNLDSVQAAVDAITELLGMQIVGKTNVVPDGARTHTLTMSGIFYGDIPVLSRAAFLLDPKPVVTLKISIRSKDLTTVQTLINSIR